MITLTKNANGKIELTEEEFQNLILAIKDELFNAVTEELQKEIVKDRKKYIPHIKPKVMGLDMEIEPRTPRPFEYYGIRIVEPCVIPTRFEMVSNEPKFKVGEHVYILRRMNDSKVISSEKIRQVHAGKHAISYTLYGETIRRKQADIFKTYEDAERELKGETTL